MKFKVDPKSLQQAEAALWEMLPDGQKLDHLLKMSLWRKRQILSLSVDEELDKDEVAVRQLILNAANSTINQVLQLEANALRKPPSDDLEKVIEERRQKARLAIEKMG